MFSDYSQKEHEEKLESLGITNYFELVDKTVGYVKPSYGRHIVLRYDENAFKVLLGRLEIDDIVIDRFECSPFDVFLLD